MKIRFEQPGDKEQIRAIHLAAFDTEAEARLVDALRADSPDLISQVAVEEHQVIGHILFSPMSAAADIKIMGLAPMAVLPARQRQGIGSELVKAGLKACELSGCAVVVVLGHPDYYPRFGFLPAEEFAIRSEYDVPPGVFMVQELQPGSLQGLRGTVKYHQLFRDL